MRPQIPETSDVYKYDVNEVMTRLSEIYSFIIEMNESKPIYEFILKSIHDLFGLTEIVLNMIEDSGKKEVLATYGYDRKTANEIINHDYPEDWFKFEMKEEFRVTKNGYLIDGEKWAQFIKENPEYEDLAVYSNSESLFAPREFSEQWHEGDFFDFVVRDELGNVIGYLEIGDSDNPEILPPREVIEMVDIFAQLVGVASKIESKIIAQKRKRESANMLAVLLAEEMMPKLKESVESLARAEKDTTNVGDTWNYTIKSLNLLTQSISILSSAKIIMEIESRPYSLLTTTSIPSIIRRWKKEIEQKYRHMNFEISIEVRGRCNSKLDNRFLELMSSIIELFNLQHKKGIKNISIRIFTKEEEKDKWINIRIGSKELDANDLRTFKVLLRQHMGVQIGAHAGAFQMYIINRIIFEYNGIIDIIREEDIYGIILKLPVV